MERLSKIDLIKKLITKDLLIGRSSRYIKVKSLNGRNRIIEKGNIELLIQPALIIEEKQLFSEKKITLA